MVQAISLVRKAKAKARVKAKVRVKVKARAKVKVKVRVKVTVLIVEVLVSRNIHTDRLTVVVVLMVSREATRLESQDQTRNRLA